MSKKQVIRTLFYIGLVLILVLFVSKYTTTRKEIRRLKTIESQLRKETRALQIQLDRLNYDLKHSNTFEFIEKSARERGMIKPREILIIDLDKEKEEDPLE
ncbi:MAG: septum formation initiator family protein [Tissierellia bacterium]|nr:septum formation initiator family protein [Tissierellia bacterium]